MSLSGLRADFFWPKILLNKNYGSFNQKVDLLTNLGNVRFYIKYSWKKIMGLLRSKNNYLNHKVFCKQFLVYPILKALYAYCTMFFE